MPGTKEIRSRIKSVKNIGQITKAMELVSASKMRRAQEAALAGRQYNATMYDMLGRLLSQADPAEHPLLRQLESSSNSDVLMIVFGTDKGLCGGLITNLTREIWRYKQTKQRVHFVTMGKKSRDTIIRLGGEVIADFPLHEKSQLRDIVPMTRLVLKEYEEGHYGEVVIANTRFMNTLIQKPRIHQLLPLSAELVERSASSYIEPNIHIDESQEFIFEPSISFVLQQLLPRFIEMTLFQSLLEAQASEHSARMMAMKSAGDNARDLKDALTLTYNQLRQASITAELAEISSGVNA